MFGLIACLVFVWAKPWMEERIHPEPASTAEPIILPWEEETSAEETSSEAAGTAEESAASTVPEESKDPESEEPDASGSAQGNETPGGGEAGSGEAGESGDVEPEGGAEPGNETQAEGTGTGPGGDPPPEETLSLEERIQSILDVKIQEILKTRDFTLEDYKRLNGFLSMVINQANHGIVLLTAESTEEISEELKEWETPGALFLITESEGFILMDYSRAQECAVFQVRFYNGAIGRGNLKAADRRTGLAVLSVSRELLDQAQILESDSLVVGSSYTASLGQAVVAVGNPYGPVYSAAFGRLVHLPGSKAGIDNERRMLYADISAASGGGFLINLDGEILGLTTENTREETETGYRNFLAVTDLKPTIERLVNGREAAYLGVTGTAVTRERTEEYGTPPGLYLTDVVAGSPAYNSGIQSGDVLLSLNGVPISFMKDVQTFLGTVDPGQEVEVRLCRQGKDEYVEQIYTVVIGAR